MPPLRRRRPTTHARPAQARARVASVRGTPRAGTATPGWSVHDGDDLEARLAALAPADNAACAPPRTVMLHEGGAPLAEVLQPAEGARQAAGVVLVLGDHLGYTVDEAATLQRLGAQRATLGAVPLLTSQCIVLCHWHLDGLAAQE